MNPQLDFAFGATIISDVRCPMCGEHIRTVRRGDVVESEYSDDHGRCWYCSSAARQRRERDCTN